MIAATGLTVVLALGITLVILRARGGTPDEHTAAASPSTTEPVEPPRAPGNAPTPVAHERREHPRAPVAATPAQTPPEEVPEWERKPLRTDQPFPEEARIDPPTPRMKIPPEMLIPPGKPDAAP